MPPIHPAIVHFPIALGVSSVAADSAGLLLNEPSVLGFAKWSLIGAAATAIAAAAAGYADMKRAALTEATHKLVHLHRASGVTLVVGLLLLATWRWFVDQPSSAYMLVGWVIVGLTLFQAWLGGELVYARGAGVAPADQGTEPQVTAKLRTARLYASLTGKKLSDDNGHRGDEQH